MPINDSERSTDVILSSKTRWLAVATGCFVAVVGSLRLGLGFVSVPSFLIGGCDHATTLPPRRKGAYLRWRSCVKLLGSCWCLLAVYEPAH